MDAGNATFAEPEEPSNLPDLRKFDEAARKYDAVNVLAQWFATDAWNFTLGVNSRYDDYDKSLFGLQKDDVLAYNAEISYSPGENLSFFLFGQRSDRKVRQKSRQSGATPSTNPLDDWSIKFKEVNDNWGLGMNGKLSALWSYDVTANYSKSDGEADFTAFPGGAPLTPARPLLDIPNYEDIKLVSVLGRLNYKITPAATAGLFYRYEDYTIDSFILQGLQNYLPGALLLNGDVGDYKANIFGLDLSLRF